MNVCVGKLLHNTWSNHTFLLFLNRNCYVLLLLLLLLRPGMNKSTTTTTTVQLDFFFGPVDNVNESEMLGEKKHRDSRETSRRLSRRPGSSRWSIHASATACHDRCTGWRPARSRCPWRSPVASFAALQMKWNEMKWNGKKFRLDAGDGVMDNRNSSKWIFLLLLYPCSRWSSVIDGTESTIRPPSGGKYPIRISERWPAVCCCCCWPTLKVWWHRECRDWPVRHPRRDWPRPIWWRYCGGRYTGRLSPGSRSRRTFANTLTRASGAIQTSSCPLSLFLDTKTNNGSQNKFFTKK